MITDAPTITQTDRRLMVQAEPLLVSAKDAARLCGISVRLWRSWDSAGRCPEAVLSGGCKRWLFDELKSWAAARAPSRTRWAAIQSGRRKAELA